MLGNEAAKRTLSTFFDTITSTGEVQFPFLIVEGDDGNGVLEYVLQQVQGLIGGYQQDLLLLRDMTSEIDKKRHALQVDVPSKEQIIDSEMYGPVANLGARDISTWLTLAPAGTTKIVIIQHIDRMTTNAANALLKSFEEPLPGRIIVGTTQNVRGLLDTIVSRAFVVQTVTPDITTFVQGEYPEQDPVLMRRVCALVGYDKTKIGELLATPDIMTSFTSLEEEVFSTGAGFRLVALAKDLRKNRTDVQLLDALLSRADQQQHYPLVQKLTTAKSMIAANVNADHVRFGLGM